jgi:predicted MPP superfamily phosphohydrolase
MKITIAHLSDLHCSKAKLPDLKIVTKALWDDFTKIEKQLDLKPDLVFFTGDLISKGEKAKEELDIANRIFLQPLLEKLKLQNTHLFIIPGNHEVDQSKISEVFEEGLKKKLSDMAAVSEYYAQLPNRQEDFKIIKRKLTDFSSFKNKHSSPSSRKENNYFFDTHKLEINNIKIGIICLNSVWRSSQFCDDEKRLIIGENIFLEALETVKDCDLKFVLSHHSFDMLADWDQKNIRIAMAKNVDMFFTGHIHDSDFSYIQPILGSLYASTCASIFSGRICNGYSVIQINLTTKTLSVYLRKWYDTRKEFDQETAKCEKGLLQYPNFKCNNEETNKLIQIYSIKNAYTMRSLPPSIILPFDSITEVKLKDVYVDPLIAEHSTLTKDERDRRYVDLSVIIKKTDNILFLSKKEYGKSTLLRHIQSEILKDDITFANAIPVCISFSQLPRNNPKSVTKVIRQALECSLSDAEIQEFLEKGNIVFLLDDFDDYNDDYREKKKNILYELCRMYPKNRYILTMNEKVSQTLTTEAVNISSRLNAQKYYLCSFKTAEIRKLLTNWAAYQHFDVDSMLNQIVFYFQQLQIPVTPMAVTLFIGVLVRDRASKNINNEAYLIENYLESILEKLDRTDSKSDMDFRDKESFLSHIAYTMMKLGRYEWSQAEFEKEKIIYFDNFGEDIPSSKIFDDFFKKQILQKVNNLISFRFRFWFNFFLAKAMQKDDAKKKEILDSPRYLRFADALAYKAGLDRNDKMLLDAIDQRTTEKMQEFFDKHAGKSIDILGIDKKLINYEKDIEKSIKERNYAAFKDSQQDDRYFPDQEEDQKIHDDEEYDDVVELVTLNSDIIRNTREIDNESKKNCLSNNVSAYLAIMWQTVELFKDMLNTIDKKKLSEFLIVKLKKDKELDIEQLLNRIRQIIFQIIPSSIIDYMSEHLSNPKLKISILELVRNEQKIDKKIFFALLLLKVDIDSAIAEIKMLINNSKSYVIDHIIYTHILFFCFQNKLEANILDKLISLMNQIRDKYPIKTGKMPVFLRDTFTSDVKKDILILHEKKLG